MADSDRIYHVLGRTGLRVSPLALGTMTFGQDDWGSDEPAARAMFEHYLESGGNFVDTANIYAGGRSEQVVGRLIEETGSRDRVVLATKFTQNTDPGNPNTTGNGRKNIVAALDASLRRLGTDYVDLYWLHIWDLVTPVEEVVSTFDALVRQGKVRAVGLSNVPAWYAVKADLTARLNGWEPIAGLQMEYSLVEREIEREHVPAARDLGMGLISWSPLASGFLTGKYRPDGTELSGPGRLDTPMFRQVQRTLGGRSRRDWAVLETVVAIAEELGCEPAQVALAWVAGRPGVTSTLIGARNLEQLKGNLAALDIDLDNAQRARLDEASRPPQVRPYLMFDHDLQTQFVTPGLRIIGPGA